MPRSRVALLGLVPFLILAAGSTPADEPSPERRAALHNLLVQDCGSCHGLTMRGGLGPALLPETLAGKPASYLQATILYGRPGTPMPPWRPFLSDADAAWMVATLQRGIDP